MSNWGDIVADTERTGAEGDEIKYNYIFGKHAREMEQLGQEKRGMKQLLQSKNLPVGVGKEIGKYMGTPTSVAREDFIKKHGYDPVAPFDTQYPRGQGRRKTKGRGGKKKTRRGGKKKTHRSRK